MARILVVDDDDLVRAMMCQSLRKAGHTTAEANNGDSALKALESGPRPDLVIMDIIMPEKEGFETIIELRKQMPDMKILAVSGGGRAGELRFLSFAEKLGASATLPKPFGARELVAVVEQVLQQ